ncbi:putative signal peptide and transmembrane protein [Rhodopirellula islandica]|uniref:Signal peptide and transmembrane protein n=1 Tax=Rhodopirellula islandica TaxID=595434 RepID=A0A0J1B7C9_RHOIS|nr:hypothetical protein [Rhodopirellula islandica]KLU02642.1 putative signal peptide and transmembrane protein [Rhodopirellula islandica]
MKASFRRLRTGVNIAAIAMAVLSGHSTFSDEPPQPTGILGSDERSSDIGLAQKHAVHFLESWNDFPADFACWMDSQITQIVERSEDPQDIHMSEIIALGPGDNNKASWTYHGFGEVPVQKGLSTTRPLWDHRLRVNQKPAILFVRQATLSTPLGVSKYIIGEEPDPPRTHRAWFHPFVLPFARHSNLLSGRCTKEWFTSIFLNKDLIENVEWSDDRETLTASYVYGGVRIPIICKVTFSKKNDWLPTLVDYRLKKNGALVATIGTSYEKRNGRWLPKVVEQMSVSGSGKTRINSHTELDWRIADESPDGAPDSDDDWRLHFCKIFEKDCLDPRMERQQMFNFLKQVGGADSKEANRQ